MTTGLSDSDPETERVWVQLMRQTPVWRRLELVAEMNATVRLLSLSGLQRRYPQATPQELQRRLADLLLGEELAARAYGPLTQAGAAE